MWEMPKSALEENEKAWTQRVHTEDMPALRGKTRTAVNTGVPTQSYFHLALPDDRTRWVPADIYPVIENGAVSRVVTYASMQPRNACGSPSCTGSQTSTV